jgi:Asp-tRNA(Asn)/Glu-tRNA(Gln) amidotransferase A subunit family amidase
MKPESASEIAAAVSSRKLSATQVIDATLAKIASVDPKLNAFTDVVASRAKQRARKRSTPRAHAASRPVRLPACPSR